MTSGSARSGPPGTPGFDLPLPAGLDDDLDAYIAATAGDEPPSDDAAFLVDPEAGPPMGEDFWLGQLSQEELEEMLAERAVTDPPLLDLPLDVIGHDGTGLGGTGFESGSVLDGLPPGPVLTAALEEVRESGLDTLSDDALAGVMLAARRLESRGTAMLLAATAELTRRRDAIEDPQVSEHTDNEIAILLATSRRAGRRLMSFAGDLAQLPATSAALWEGQIDRVKADVIAYETGLLDPELAGAVELLVIEDAPRLTPSKLRARLQRAVIAADPDAARRRAEEAARDARVELSPERSGGTAALSGRDLPVPGAVAADQRIDAAARALKAAGVAATLAQLRAAVFLGLLTGSDPLSFLPPPETGGETANPTRDPARDQGTSARTSAASDTGHPATPATGGPARSASDVPDTAGGRAPGPPPGGAAGQGDGGPGAGSGSEALDTDPLDTDAPDTEPVNTDAPDTDAPDTDARGGWPGKLTLRGSVHLTMPLASWLGATRSPGEIAAFGPVGAETCQEMADWIAANPGSRWCLTLTDKAGHAVAHGCARRPPPPRDDTQRLAAWLARLKVGPIEAGTCTHAREVPGYRIPESLHHIVKVRQRTCVNPICARPAQSCDDDHTLPYDQGGRSCECDLGPACRGCHRTKQTPGWRLEQPSPGVLVWHLPNGRSFTVRPGVYPS
jgi:hypothetical protein